MISLELDLDLTIGLSQIDVVVLLFGRLDGLFRNLARDALHALGLVHEAVEETARVLQQDGGTVELD